MVGEQIERFASGSSNNKLSGDIEKRNPPNECGIRETSNDNNRGPCQYLQPSEQEGSQDGSNKLTVSSKQRRKPCSTLSDHSSMLSSLPDALV